MSLPPWLQIAAVAVGAALGAWLRWATALWLNAVWWRGFPLGTLAVNCVGGFLIGVALVLLADRQHETLRLFAVTGFLGGLTTFSAFSGESLTLLQREQWGMALFHTLAHVLGALACAALGLVVARWIR